MPIDSAGGDPFVFRRDLYPGDLDSIGELVRSTGFFSEAEVEVARELVAERLSKGAASGYEFLVATRDQRVLGYTCYGEIPCTVGSYDLYWIVVSPLTQRQGLGRALFEQTTQDIRSRAGRRLYADTSGRPQYAPTRQFYERLGFQIEAQFADYYAPGDDKVVYGLML